MKRRISAAAAIACVCLAVPGAIGCQSKSGGDGTPSPSGNPAAVANAPGASPVVKQQAAQQAEMGRRQQQLMQAAQRAH